MRAPNAPIDPASIAQAVATLRSGGLVAFPTETVYGLGADARNPSAVAKVYALKGRPPGHPLIVHLAQAEQLADWVADIPPAAERLASAFWPGPLTLILRRRSGVPDAVTGGQESVGLRVPSHPVAHALLAAFGGGIAAPSANRYGHVSPTLAEHVREEFGVDTPCLLEGGPCEVGLESTIVSLIDEPLLLRPGAITQPELERLIGPVRRAAVGEGPRAPGTTFAHYAPATPVRVVTTADLRAYRRENVAVLSLEAPPPGFPGVWITTSGDPAQYGHDLYAHLRQLDHQAKRLIVVEAVPEGPAWEAARDRLLRAGNACVDVQIP